MAWERARAPRHWTGFTLIAATVMLATPLWNVWAPAMPDYPAHLASFALIEQGTFHRGMPGGNAFYHLQWSFVPNLASEIIVPFLAQLTGVVVATKLFLTTALFLWIAGPGAVHRALYGRVGIAPLFGSFFAYNANFVWGFFNYYFASGLSFAIFAAWIATNNRNGMPRLMAFTCAITILYYCHIFAAASLLLMLIGYEGLDYIRNDKFRLDALLERGMRLFLLYVPALLSFVLLKPAGADSSDLEFNLLDTLLDRFESLVEFAFDNSDYVVTIALFAGLGLALVFRKARLHPAMWGTLGLLLIGALGAPEWALGGWAVHLRLPAVFGAMLFAATEFRMKPPVRAGLAVLALALIAFNAIRLTQNWLGYDRHYREFQAAVEEIPRGARLLTVLDGNAIGERPDQPYWHMAEFAIPERGGFTPLLFTTKGQHVVQWNQPYARYSAQTAEQGSPPDVDELAFLAAGKMDADLEMKKTLPYLNHFQCHFDIAVVVHLGGKRTPVPPMLRLRHSGSFFSFYDILPDQSCGA